MISSSKEYIPARSLLKQKISEKYSTNHDNSNLLELSKYTKTESIHTNCYMYPTNTYSSYSSNFLDLSKNTEIEKKCIKFQSIRQNLSSSSLTEFDRFKDTKDHFFPLGMKRGLTDHNIRSHEKNIFYLERYRKKIYASAYIVFWIEELFDNYEFDKVNTVLLDIDIQFLEEWSIVALLRSTYFAKSHLPAWNSFYKNAKDYLDDLKKEDVEGILMGLDR